MFRGREVTHPERGTRSSTGSPRSCPELGVVEQRPMQEGRNMTMMMAPVQGRARRARVGAAPTAPPETPARARRRRHHGAAARQAADEAAGRRDAAAATPPRRRRAAQAAAAAERAPPTRLRRAPPADPAPRPRARRRAIITGRRDAEDEDPFRRQEALQGDRQRQGPRPSRLHEPHPREEVAETQARARPPRRSSPSTTSRASRRCWGWASDPRQALRPRAQEAPRDARADEGLPRRGALELQARQGGAAQGRRLRLPRPPQPQARLPPPVDHAHQRRRARRTA